MIESCMVWEFAWERERASSVGVEWVVRFVLGNGLHIYSSVFLYKTASSRGFLYNTCSLDLYSSIFSYIRSVRKVSLMPPVTSAPECNKPRCWNISTLPTFGPTSKEHRMSCEWNVVAPP